MSRFQVKRSTAAIVVGVIATAVLTYADIGTKNWALDELSSSKTNPPPVCAPATYSEGKWVQTTDGEGAHIYNQRSSTRDVVLVEDYLMLRYTENCGAAFSMLRNASSTIRGIVLVGGAVFAIMMLLYFYLFGEVGRLFLWGVPFVVSGAIGNVYDRFRLGYVVDFIRFHLNEGWEWPTFNIADATILIGVVLMMVDAFFNKSEADSPTKE